MDDFYLYLLVGQLFKRLLYCLHRALYVCLYDNRQLLHLSLADLLEQIVKSYLVVLAELLLLSLVLSLLNKLSCQLFVCNCVEHISCARHFSKTCYLNRCRRTCLGNSSSLVVGHGPYSSHRCSRNKNVSGFERTVLHQKCRNRSLALIQPCLDNGTLCQLIGVSFKLFDLCHKQYIFKQIIYSHSGLCGNRHSDNVAAPLLNDQVVLGELLFYPVGICGILIHFVYGNDYGNACCLCMVYGLYRLGHDTVIGCNYEYSYIRNVCASCSHGGKSLMSRGIKESYLLALVCYLISTDMLSDTACLTVGNVSVSYLIKDRCLTVVNVTHNNYNRASWLEVLCLVLFVNDKPFLDSNNDFLFHLCAQLVGNDSSRIKIDHLIYSCHYPKAHKLFDNHACGDFKS